MDIRELELRVELIEKARKSVSSVDAEKLFGMDNDFVYETSLLIISEMYKEIDKAANAAEYERCKNDPVYFINKYFTYLNVGNGHVNITLKSWQEKYAKSFHRLMTEDTTFDSMPNELFSMRDRQEGKTLLLSALLLWVYVFYSDMNIVLFSCKKEMANHIVDRVYDANYHLPKYMRQNNKNYRRGFLKSENNVCINIGTDGVSTMGHSINLAVFDEFRFNNNYFDAMKSIKPNNYVKLIGLSS